MNLVSKKLSAYTEWQNLRRGEIFCWMTGDHQPGDVAKATSGLEECQQVVVQLVFVCVREAMRCPRVDL